MPVRAVAIVLAAFLAATTPALAHTDDELAAWSIEWTARAESGATPALLAEWRDMAERHPCRVAVCPPRPPRIARAGGIAPVLPTPQPGGFPAAVERWRPLVAIYFPAENVDAALSVMACESQGNEWADNPRSSASGLMQHMGSLWPPRAEAAGWGGASIWDPAANIAVAAWLSKGGSDWGHWAASRHCHGL